MVDGGWIFAERMNEWLEDKENREVKLIHQAFVLRGGSACYLRAGRRRHGPVADAGGRAGGLVDRHPLGEVSRAGWPQGGSFMIH